MQAGSRGVKPSSGPALICCSLPFLARSYVTVNVLEDDLLRSGEHSAAQHSMAWHVSHGMAGLPVVAAPAGVRGQGEAPLHSLPLAWPPLPVQA